MQVQVESAIALSDTQVSSLREQLSRIFDQEIELELVVDPKTLGGLRLTTSVNTLDLTIAAKFNTLKTSLLSTQ